MLTIKTLKACQPYTTQFSSKTYSLLGYWSLISLMYAARTVNYNHLCTWLVYRAILTYSSF